MTAYPYQAVLFDLGGTLFDHLPAVHTAANLCTTAQGAGIDPTVLQKAYQKLRAELEAQWRERSFFMHRAMVATALTRTLESLIGKADPDLVTEFCDAQRQAVHQHLSLRPDTLDTLRTLKKRNVLTGIVSNIDDDYLEPLVERHGLTRLMDFWLSSEAAESCKPDPSIFVQALKLADHPAGDVLFVGDSPANDVDGAAAHGLATALICPADGSISRTTPTYTINTLAALTSL